MLYSDGWQLPEQGGDAEVLPEIPDSVRAVAANGVRRPLVARESVQDGVWAIDPTSGQLTMVQAPTVRYTPESGTAAGWGTSAPESNPVTLARSTSRVTRSRKGRTSFVVQYRGRHTVTVGSRDAIGADWSVPPGRWSGAQLAAMAEAFVRSVAWQTGGDVDPLPRLIGSDDGRQMSRPMVVDVADVADVVDADFTVPADGGGIWAKGRSTVERRPYRLSTSRSAMHAPGVTAQHFTLTGIDDQAAWRGHESNGIADAYRLRKLATKPPSRIVKRTSILASVSDGRGRRRLIRGTVVDGVQALVAPGVGGWWIGHTFHPDNRKAATSRKDRADRSRQLAAVKASTDGWLTVAVALGVGQVVEVDGATLRRPTVERFVVTVDGVEHGGRTAAAAIVKARRTLNRVS